jgi:hypothetical protein
MDLNETSHGREIFYRLRFRNIITYFGKMKFILFIRLVPIDKRLAPILAFQSAPFTITRKNNGSATHKNDDGLICKEILLKK